MVRYILKTYKLQKKKITKNDTSIYNNIKEKKYLIHFILKLNKLVLKNKILMIKLN